MTDDQCRLIETEPMLTYEFFAKSKEEAEMLILSRLGEINAHNGDTKIVEAYYNGVIGGKSKQEVLIYDKGADAENIFSKIPEGIYERSVHFEIKFSSSPQIVPINDSTQIESITPDNTEFQYLSGQPTVPAITSKPTRRNGTGASLENIVELGVEVFLI